MDAVSQVEVEVQNGATWMNPEASVNALMRFPKIPESLARSLIATNSKDERFNLVWDYITDEEKNTTITVNFDYYHNFWPNFNFHARAITMHAVNTRTLNDLKEKVLHLENESRLSSIRKKQKIGTPTESASPATPIHYIENKGYHQNNNDRQLIYKPAPIDFKNKTTEDILTNKSISIKRPQGLDNYKYLTGPDN